MFVFQCTQKTIWPNHAMVTGNFITVGEPSLPAATMNFNVSLEAGDEFIPGESLEVTFAPVEVPAPAA
jgi:hypothetical protein